VTSGAAEPPLAAAALRARRLGVLGGSFDPPHLGHLHAARAARTAFALDHVVFVPAAHPPHKPERALAEARHRLALLALLLGDDPAFSIWGAELARAGPSYTVLDVPKPGDVYILCSDGLAGPVSDPEIARLTANVTDLSASSQSLVDLANEHGGPDNVTVVLCKWMGAG
jgi:cytidyltransferase-like protein